MAHGCSGSGEAGLLGRRRHLLSGTPSSTRFSLPLLSGAPRDAIQKMSHSSPPLDLIGTKFYDQYFKKEKKKSEGNSFKYRKIKKKTFFRSVRSALRIGAFSEVIQPSHGGHICHTWRPRGYASPHFRLYAAHFQGDHSKEEAGTPASPGGCPRRPVPGELQGAAN